MEPAQVFQIVQWVVLPGWVLLIFAPRWKATQPIAALVIPGILAVIYLGYFLSYFGQVPDGFGAFGSLAGVRAAFGIDGMLLAGWIHYLAFDLFVGCWEVRDARRLRIHHFLVIPCLGLTFMMGPVGLLAYLLLRAGLRRSVTVEDPVPVAAV